MPGTTSTAGRMSVNTGSAAQISSTAFAFARSCDTDPVCMGAELSGEWLVIALLEELELLPLPVDSRVEALGMLGNPDLRADDEVVRIELERGSPEPHRLVTSAGRVEAHAP